MYSSEIFQSGIHTQVLLPTRYLEFNRVSMVQEIKKKGDSTKEPVSSRLGAPRATPRPKTVTRGAQGEWIRPQARSFGASLERGRRGKNKNQLGWIFIIFLIGLAAASKIKDKQGQSSLASSWEQLAGNQVVFQMPLVNAAEYASMSSDLEAQIALFPRSVVNWKHDIARWKALYGESGNFDEIDIATLMTIETCGNDKATSRDKSGNPIARGLFQIVHKYHSKPGDIGPEVLYDAEVSAERGLTFFDSLIERSYAHGGTKTNAYIGYNAGASVMFLPANQRGEQSQRYEQWSYIADDARRMDLSMPTLRRWLEAGGWSLCAQAEIELGITK